MKSHWAFVCIVAAGLVAAAPRGAGAEPAAREVSFKGAGGTTIAGTLFLPSDAHAPVPALLLLAGSGPTDRNGNQPPALRTELLSEIAEDLARRGIATFRFDKRGMYANRGQLPKNNADYGDFFAWENFVGDAVAAYRFLLEQPGVDPSRCGILGHSEGGIIALQAADVLGTAGKSPKVLVLLGTPGRTIDVLMTEQLESLLKRQKASAEQTKFFVAANGDVWKSLRDTGKVPGGVPAGLAPLYPAYLGRFLHEEMLCDPAKLAAKFKGPVLLINGADDIQVSADRDTKLLAAALGPRAGDDHVLMLVPHASHNLKNLKGPDDPGIAGPIVPEAMKLIESWTAEKLGGGSAGKP